MAVTQVEGRGFGPFGRPTIPYELHMFSGYTNGTYNHTHPHLSQPTLAAGNRYHDNSQATEWSHLYGAMILRESAAGPHRICPALWSASWGMFQATALFAAGTMSSTSLATCFCWRVTN